MGFTTPAMASVDWPLTLDAVGLGLALSGALWAYLRFWREGIHKPRIEFDLACDFLGPQSGSYVAAFRVIAANRGHVEYRFQSIRLRALGIESDQKLAERSGASPMLSFPVPLFKKAELVPPDFGYFFVRPGVRQEFSYTTHIPASVRFLVARATFRYQGTDDLHTTERVFEVRPGQPARGSEKPASPA